MNVTLPKKKQFQSIELTVEGGGANGRNRNGSGPLNRLGGSVKSVDKTDEEDSNENGNYNGSFDDEDDEDDEDEEQEELLDVRKPKLPKDVGEINVRGHLRFDEEMPPDEVTKNNTMFNALMYHMSHSYYKQDEAEIKQKQQKGTDIENIIKFDTFSANLDVQTYHLTKIVQDKGYEYHNMSKTWLVPYDEEKPSEDAVEWTFEELADNNDTVVVVKVESLQSIMKIGISGHRKKSNELFKKVQQLKLTKTHKHIKLVTEVKIGAVDYMINKSIRDFDPIAIIMGTKGIKKATITSFLLDDTATTKQFLEHSRIPVIVINPSFERKEMFETKTEANILERLTSYPSVYNPHTGAETLQMERLISSDSISATSTGTSRTSRFLRIGKSLSRNTSPASQSPSLHPTHSNDLRSIKSGESSDTLSPIRSNSSLRRALSPFRMFKR